MYVHSNQGVLTDVKHLTKVFVTTYLTSNNNSLASYLTNYPKRIKFDVKTLPPTDKDTI
jgi:hypothetical protein